MRHIAFAVLLLLLEIGGRLSASNVGNVISVSAGDTPSQSGSEVTNASACPAGNAKQGSCGQENPRGITYATTTLDWKQAISKSAIGGSKATVTLTPCPVGIDTTSGAGYQVLINDARAETVSVAGGTCTSGLASGTIVFTPFFSHTSYTMESASAGIQETINAACGTSANFNANDQCHVIIPANGPYTGGSGWSINNYNVYGTIFFHGNQSVLSGYGTSLNCLGRGPCVQIGDLRNANDYANVTVQGLSFRTPTDYSANSAYAGMNITNTSDANGYATITTSAAHNFRPGDLVTIMFTDDRSYWGRCQGYRLRIGFFAGSVHGIVRHISLRAWRHDRFAENSRRGCACL